MKTISLNSTFSLPAASVTNTFAILAVRGAGKSNTGAVMAEGLFRAGLPFCVIDPVGSWWGLRSSADGKEPGLAIPIFGGRHGDVPLERGGGELIAELVVEKRLSCVLDLSEFPSESDKKAFLLSFARRLYLKNQDPLHLFLEEADDYIPQKPMRDEAQLLRAWENIVRRGRSRGLGMTLITQRSAAINKMVLTQVETLIAMRTTSPQDRAAIEAWIKYHAEKGEILESLPSLKDGEAWVWSPHFLKVCERVQIRRRSTFDSGATPKNSTASSKRPAATMADIDLAAIQSRMAETIERAKADDPRELRRTIVALQQQLGRDAQPSVDTAAIAKQAERKGFERGYQQASDEALKRWELARTSLDRVYAIMRNGLQKKMDVLAASSSSPSEPPKATTRQVDPKVDYALSGPEKRILNAIAWLEDIGIESPEQTAVAFLAGYTIGGGAYGNPRGALRGKGFIEYVAGERIRLTDSGREIADHSQVPLDAAELQSRILARLPGPEQRILKVLIDAYPNGLVNEECASRAGYAVGGGAYGNPRGRLRTLGLIEYVDGKVKARPLLFLEKS